MLVGHPAFAAPGNRGYHQVEFGDDNSGKALDALHHVIAQFAEIFVWIFISVGNLNIGPHVIHPAGGFDLYLLYGHFTVELIHAVGDHLPQGVLADGHLSPLFAVERGPYHRLFVHPLTLGLSAAEAAADFREYLNGIGDKMGMVALHFDGGHRNNVLALLVAGPLGPADVVLRGNLLNKHHLGWGRQIKALGASGRHALGGSQKQDLADFPGTNRFNDLVPVQGIVEEGGAHRADVHLFPFGRFAGHNAGALNQKPVVDNVVNAVLFGHQLGAETLSRAALADQCVYFGSPCELPQAVYNPGPPTRRPLILLHTVNVNYWLTRG